MQAEATFDDMSAVRRYLAGVEALAREARTTSNPAVLRTALEVLRRQGTTAGEILNGHPLPELGREHFNISPEEMERKWGRR